MNGEEAIVCKVLGGGGCGVFEGAIPELHISGE